MIARRMQEQIFSEALQEQTPTCFSPITGMLGGSTAVDTSSYNSRLQRQMSGTGAAQPTTLSDAVGSVWNSVSSLGQQVTQSIVDTASAWMAPPGSEEEGE